MVTLMLNNQFSFDKDAIIIFPEENNLTNFPYPKNSFTSKSVRAALQDTSVPSDNAGWDTVFAVPVSKVNDKLKDYFTTPIVFSHDMDGNVFDVNINQATCTLWKIVPGGKNGNVFFEITLTGGQAIISGKTSNTYPLTGGVIILEIMFSYISVPPSGSNGGAKYNLLANTNTASGQGGSIPGADYESIGAISEAFADYYNNNPNQLLYVFNTVTINDQVSDPGFQWIQSTTVGYAYANGSSDDNAVFAVLCTVNGRVDSSLTNVLNPSSIPQNCESSFNISPQCFIQYMVLPVLPAAFNAKGTSEVIDSSYFNVDNTGISITNSKDIPLAPVTHLGLQYHPVIKKFSVEWAVTEVIISSHVETEVSPGITAVVDTITYYYVTGESNTLQYNVDTSKSSVTKSYKVATGIIVSAAILAIILAVAAVVAVVFVEGATLVIVGVILAIAIGLTEALPGILIAIAAKGINNEIPSLANLISNSASKIYWPGSSDLYVSFAQFFGTLQLGGVAFPNS